MSPQAAAIRVAVGVVADGGRVLVRRRTRDPGMGTVWEFPGGKLDAGEDPEGAAVREVLEETGLPTRAVAWLCSVGHDYPDRRIELHAFVLAPAGRSAAGPRGSFRWLPVSECRRLPMPAANLAVLDALEWYGLERPGP